MIKYDNKIEKVLNWNVLLHSTHSITKIKFLYYFLIFSYILVLYKVQRMAYPNYKSRLWHI